MTLRDQGCGLGVLEHEDEPLGGIVGIQRHVCAAGLEGSEQSDDHVGSAFKTESNACVWADAESDELMSELVGASVQGIVAELRVLMHESDGVRGARDLLFEQGMDTAPLRIGNRSIVPLLQQLVPLRGTEDVDGADAQSG